VTNPPTRTAARMAAVASPVGVENQPVSHVRWVPVEDLSANDWNPNIQAPPELKLLKLSILENGWTQPIVSRVHDGGSRLEIVDGYHRSVVGRDPQVAAMTGGLVPVVDLPETDDATARMSTVRHNRARGTHHVLKMADIVAALIGMGVDVAEVGRRLGMDEEEVDRLADRGNMLKRAAAAEFGNGWTVGPATDQAG
jgi:ParB-like chromosome segregation protein Spo0J